MRLAAEVPARLAVEAEEVAVTQEASASST